MGICFPRRICWFSIFLVVQKQFAWKIDLTYLGFWCCGKKDIFWDSCGASKSQQSFAVMTAAFAELTALANQASISDPMVGQTAGVTFSGGTNADPFLHSWSAQGCRHVSGRNWVWAWVGRDQTCFHPPQPLLDRTHWTYSHESPEAIRGTIPLSHFRPPQHTPIPTVL